MFEFVQFRYAFVVIVFITLEFHNIYCLYAQSTVRRGGVDVFNLLLGLYKLNPLKGSKVYSKFTKNILARSDLTSILASEEKRQETINYPELKDIENLIHPLNKKQSKHSLGKPEYDLEQVDTENFNVNVMLPDNLKTELSHGTNYDPRNILEIDGILNSRENMMSDNAPNTKLLPVNQLLLPNSIRRNPTLMKQLDNIFEADNTEKQYKQFPPDFQQPALINDNVLTADVVVL